MRSALVRGQIMFALGAVVPGPVHGWLRLHWSARTAVGRTGPLRTGPGHNLGPVVVRARIFSADFPALPNLRRTTADHADIFEHSKGANDRVPFV
jgi:hypothetical protein